MPKNIKLYSMKHLGSLFDSEFLRNFSQLENIFKKHLKCSESMKKFIGHVNKDPNPILADNFYTNEDMNKFDMKKVESDKYYVNLHKDQIKTTADFEFFLISSKEIKYFYATSKEMLVVGLGSDILYLRFILINIIF